MPRRIIIQANGKTKYVNRTRNGTRDKKLLIVHPYLQVRQGSTACTNSHILGPFRN